MKPRSDFDLLTKPEPKLTKAQEVEVKKVARELLINRAKSSLILIATLEAKTASPEGQQPKANISLVEQNSINKH
jgi:hypothetical protein